MEDLHTHIFLPNVDSFRTHGKRNIDAIIDEEWYIELLGYLMKPLPYTNQVCCFASLVAILYDCYT